MKKQFPGSMSGHTLLQMSIGILTVAMFILYGFTLTTLAVFIGLLIFRNIAIKPDAMIGRQYISLWFLYLLSGGLVSLVTLHQLYNPSMEVFANLDHHALKFTGYVSSNGTVCLLDGRSNPTQTPLYELAGNKGYSALKGDEHGIVLRQNICQPVYVKAASLNGKFTSNSVHRLLNADQLPAFHTDFSLEFRNGSTLTVSIHDTTASGDSGFGSSVYVKVHNQSDTLLSQPSSFSRFIRRSLPLTEIISDLQTGELTTLDWSSLRGVSVVRKEAGLPPKRQVGSGFCLSLDDHVLGLLRAIHTDTGHYTAEQLTQSHTLSVPEGTFFSIGSGLDATPFIHPVYADGKLEIRMDTHVKHLLPYRKEELEKKQTVIVTSDLQAMASSETTSALYYPVLSSFVPSQQLRFALEYQPEETRTPLSCKMLLYGGDRPGTMLQPRSDGAFLIHAGDRFTVENESRYLSPVFELEDFRSTAPFTARKGYLLVLISLLAAGLSLAAGRGRLETRGETTLWLGLLLLMTYRAFLAWRTSVFPPLVGITETHFDFVYQNTKYKFDLYPIVLSIFVLLPSVLYKTWKIRKLDKAGFQTPVSRLEARIHHFLQRDRSRQAWLSFLFLPVISCLILGGGLLVVKPLLSSRLAYVFLPVVSLFCTEYLYLGSKGRGNEYPYQWVLGRYTAMLTALAVPMAKDTGFGIVFFFFLMLYNALDNWYYLRYEANFARTDSLSLFRRRIRFFIILLLLALFISVMLAGPRMISLLYHRYIIVIIIAAVVLAVIVWMYLTIASRSRFSLFWKLAPLILLAIVLAAGSTQLQSHRHFLYRSEIHIKPIDEIMMDNEFGSRDMERLFEASQNKWYLGYYLDGRSWEQAKPFSRSYDLRLHFNKGVTWDTQKTDVVLSRYVIGEHSVWSVYILLVVFILLYVSTFKFSYRSGRYTLLGCGCMLLLLCQGIFITMAVTNRFIFFGQDFPMLSLESLLTQILTLFLFGSAILFLSGAIRPVQAPSPYHKSDPKTLYLLAGVFVLMVLMDPSLSGKSTTFNVGSALQTAKNELSHVNRLLHDYQVSNRNELAESKVVTHFRTDLEIKRQEALIRAGQQPVRRPKIYQTDYSQLMHRFDETNAVAHIMDPQPGSPSGKISRFTASLYRIYRDRLSKHNSSSDIIHLKADRDGYMELAVSNKYYLLTTPESNRQDWCGNILPSEQAAQSSVVTVDTPTGQRDVPFDEGAVRLDRHSLLGYNYPIYLAKADNRWIAGHRPVFIARSGSIPVRIKNGATSYRMDKAGSSAYYMVMKNDDCLETAAHAQAGNRGGEIHIQGDIGKYFARSMLVNGKRMLVYPLGEKFFYPYHVGQLARNIYSGTDETRREIDIRLSVSYTLNERLHDILSRFSGNAVEPDARAVVVADGNGSIKAMVTAKNTGRNNGFMSISPNDTYRMGKVNEQFYLSGDYQSEEHTFGDYNLNYLLPGPGSSIKPITFTAVASMVCYDWRKLQFYYNASEQSITEKGKEVTVWRYADINKKFKSLRLDETGAPGKNGLTDIARYMERSSNYFNSLMVFMGYYEPEYLRTQLALVHIGKPSELFMPYKPNTATSFPAFALRTGDTHALFNFRQYVTNDGMGRHEYGSLAQGFERNFGLYSDYPKNIPSYETFSQRDLTGLAGEERRSLVDSIPFAFNQVSFLPDAERTSFQGTKDAITNTTLGATPFRITPLHMAQMFGRLFSQNRAYRLTMQSPATVQPRYEAFETDEKYARSHHLYEDILSNHLFTGMNNVVRLSGTAGRLSSVHDELLRKGFYLYGKTGTISNRGNTESQLLGIVISREKLHDLPDPGSLQARMKDNRFYVLYFSSEAGYHNYDLIARTIRAVVSSQEFITYMQGPAAE